MSDDDDDALSPPDAPLDEATLARIVDRVRRHPEFLAAAFDRYVRAGGPAADDLAGHLGLSRRAFLRFALYRRPRAEAFESDVRLLAADAGADPYRLAAVVRFADAAAAMSGADDGRGDAREGSGIGGAADDGAAVRPGFLAAARPRRRPRSGRGDPDARREKADDEPGGAP